MDGEWSYVEREGERIGQDGLEGMGKRIGNILMFANKETCRTVLNSRENNNNKRQNKTMYTADNNTRQH